MGTCLTPSLTGQFYSLALFSQPYSRTKTVSNVMEKKSRTTISKYMDELIEAKILSPKKEGKEIYYLNDDLIRILEG